MEVPSIHRQANRRFERASAMKQSLENLKNELKAIKAAQIKHRFRSLRVLALSAIHRQNNIPEVREELQVTTELTQTAKERASRASNMEHRIRSALVDGRVLVKLARRASGGHTYAKHQADIMVNH